MAIHPPVKQKIQEALDTPFDSSSNDFIAENVQEAAEEIDFRQITKEPTGFTTRDTSTISFNDGTRTFTITPIGDSFEYYIRGRKYEVDVADSVQITDDEGLWYIYYEGDELKASLTPWEFDSPIAFVSAVYWDAANDKAIIFEDERHGLVMDWATHANLHKTVGSRVEPNSFEAGNYYLDGIGDNNADAQISFEDGIVHDEDLIFEVKNSATPTEFYEQVLNPTAKIPIYYRAGSEANPVWRKLTASDYALYPDSPNTCFYNKIVGGNWTLVNATNKNYIATWILATNNINEPIIGILGNNEQSNIARASRLNVLSQIKDRSTLCLESKFIYRLLFKTETDYTNAPKAVLKSVSSDVGEAIEPPPKGIATFPFELHYVSGTGLNTSMSNGTIFRVRPGTFASGSFSGYPAAFPLQMPYRCKLYSINLTFRQAAFDWNATQGPILFELEFRDHFYNGSSVKTRIVVSFGNFSGNSTGHADHRYELFEDSWSYIDPLLPEEFEYSEMIGVRFVKAPSGDRRINSWTDIVMKLNFEEVVSE